MKNKNKKPLVIIIFLVLIAIISTVIFFYTRETKNDESLKVDIRNQTKENDFNKEESDEEKVEQDTELTENKKEDSNKENSVVDDKTSSNKPNETVKSENSQNKTNIKSDNNSQNNAIKKQETQPKQETATPPKVEQPKTCTPKKFDMGYVRADFSSFAACQEMGEKYRVGGYRYICDNYQDDCGDTYYMLSLTKKNSSVELDYHTIPVPKIEEQTPSE